MVSSLVYLVLCVLTIVCLAKAVDLSVSRPTWLEMRQRPSPSPHLIVQGAQVWKTHLSWAWSEKNPREVGGSSS